MDKLYYDRENKKFYVKELVTNRQGFMVVATDEEYVDVTDEIVELLQDHIAKDGKRLLCFSISRTETDNAKGDSETFAEHYGCSSDTAQEELRPVLPGAAVYEGLSDSLALAFSRYLDSNRDEWKMCLSAKDCEDIQRAFRQQDWKTIERYRIKYLFNEND